MSTCNKIVVSTLEVRKTHDKMYQLHPPPCLYYEKSLGLRLFGKVVKPGTMEMETEMEMEMEMEKEIHSSLSLAVP